ncbi:MAG: penicillin-binding transpeptidase domain-containing protein, partial [Pyrinomonadaceae bacterium]
NYSKTNFRGYYRSNLSMKPTVFERMIPGMVGAVNYGTAKTIKDNPMNIAGKTGSCIANGTWVGLFASVAPIQDPRFAVVVILEGKYARGKYAAAVAGNVYNALAKINRKKFLTPVAKRVSTPAETERVIIRLGSAPRSQTKTIEIRDEKPTPIKNEPTNIVIEIPSSDRQKSSAENSSTQKKQPNAAKSQPKTRKEVLVITRPRIVKN